MMSNRAELPERVARWTIARWLVPSVLLATFALLVASTILLAPANAEAQDEPAPVPSDIQLHVGDSVTLDGGALQVSLVQIEEDSRCPKNVMCVWMGRAVVRLRTTVDGVDKGEVTASLYPGNPPQPGSDRDAVVERYVFTVMDVQPYPVAGQPQPLDQRVVTLHVGYVAP